MGNAIYEKLLTFVLNDKVIALVYIVLTLRDNAIKNINTSKARARQELGKAVP